MVRPLRLVLAAVALAAGTVVAGPASPVWACSCASPSDADAVSGADAAFVATLLDVAPPPPAEVRSSVDPATYTFAVSEVVKGEVAERQEVVSEVSGASCGLELAGDGPFLVVATRDSFEEATRPGPGQYYAGLCGGTRPLAAGEDLSALGETRAPTPLPAPDSTSADDGGAGSRTPLAAGVLATGVALAAVGAAALRRRPAPPRP